MVGTAAIRADFLTNCIEAAATVGAGNGCDGKAWVPFGAAVAGRIFRLSGKHSHFNQGNNLPLELVKGKIQSFS